MLYPAQGASFDDADYNLNYINIPVMAKYYVAKSFNLEAGPQVGFLVSAKVDGEDVKDMFESLDFGLNVGAGYDFTEKFSAGLRYNFGLSNVLKDFEDSEIKNSVLSLSVGYKF